MTLKTKIQPNKQNLWVAIYFSQHFHKEILFALNPSMEGEPNDNMIALFHC